MHAEELEEECSQMEDVSLNPIANETSAVKGLCRRSKSLEAQDTIDASTASFVSQYGLRDKDLIAGVVRGEGLHQLTCQGACQVGDEKV
jgi:hypothetical protein